VFSGPSLADALIPDREPTVARAVPIRNSPYFDADAYKAGQTGVPQGSPTPFQSSAPAESTEPAPARSILSRNPAPSASEGRSATWTNERVLQLASWGDPQALQQARLRGLTVKSQYSPSNGSPFVLNGQ